LQREVGDLGRRLDELGAIRDRFGDLIESTSDWLWEVDCDGKYTYVSPQVRNVLGREVDDLIGTTPFDIMPPAEAERLKAVFQDFVSRAEPFEHIENVCLHADGREVVMETSGVPMHGPGGGLKGYRGVDRDITARKRAEEALRDSERQSRSLIETAPNIILHLAPDHKILEFNPEAESVLGRRREEVLSMDYLELFIPESERAEVIADIQKVLSGEQTRGYENTLIGADGIEHIYSWNVNRLMDAQDRPSGIIAIGQDVTEHRRAEEAVRQARDELEQRVAERTAELALFHQFVETSGEGMGWADVDGMVRYMNPTLLKMVGARNVQEVCGRSVLDHYSQASMQRLQDEILPAVLRDGTWTGELPLQPTTGEPLPASHSLFLLRDDQGEPVCFANVLTDLSELREGERALQQAHDELRQLNAELEQRVLDRTRDVEAASRELGESEAKYSALVEMANDGVVVIQDGLCKFANAAWARVTGYSVEELIGMPMLTTVMPEYHDIVTRRYEARLAGEQSPSVYEIKVQARDGQVRHVELSTGVLEYEGRPASMAVIRDITDRKEAEAERIRLTAILESTSDMVSTAGPDGRITYINQAGRELLGWPDDVGEVGKPIPDAHPQWAQDIVLSEGMPAATRDGIWRGETALLAPDGTEIPTSQVIMAHTSPTGEVVYYSTIIRDISERKRTEEALARSEATSRALLDAPDDVALLVDPDGKILALNETAAQRLGGSEKDLVGVCAFDLFSTEVAKNRRAKAEQVVRTVRPVRFEDERAGRWFDVSLFPILNEEGGVAQIAVTARDITERKRAEEERDRLGDQLRQAQKMEAVGQLAGGIAHDFNNILTAIQGNAQLLKMDLPSTGEQTERADEVIRGANRAADLTSQLLAFARKGKQQVVPVDIHNIVTQTVSILTHTIDKRIEIHLELHASPSTIMGDPTQLHSAMLNLGVNARDAMGDGGTLTYATRSVTLTRADCDEHAYELTPGDFLEIDVTDTGSGMNEQTQKRIFEPFFTTKEVGKGTGLGLAGVYGCVRSHDGSVSVSSKPGRGTTFTILLPLADTGASPTDRTVSSDAPVRGTGHVLIVDDEESVRNFVRTSLQNLGYTVSVCDDGAAGVDYYRKHQQEIDLVILDLVMPRMSGQDAFEEIKRINTNVRVLVSSGFSHTQATLQMLDDGALGLLNKPFQITELAQAVARYIQHAPQ